jgi:hypothetical protein
MWGAGASECVLTLPARRAERSEMNVALLCPIDIRRTAVQRVERERRRDRDYRALAAAQLAPLIDRRCPEDDPSISSQSGASGRPARAARLRR